MAGCSVKYFETLKFWLERNEFAGMPELLEAVSVKFMNSISEYKVCSHKFFPNFYKLVLSGHPIISEIIFNKSFLGFEVSVHLLDFYWLFTVTK